MTERPERAVRKVRAPSPEMQADITHMLPSHAGDTGQLVQRPIEEAADPDRSGWTKHGG